MKMLSPALSVLRHAPRASSVLCGCSPRLRTPSLHLHPQSHLSRLVLPPRPTPRTLMSMSDPTRSSSSSLASSPVVGLADPGRRPSCCSTQRAALLYSQTRLLLFGSELDSPSPAPPRPRPAAHCRHHHAPPRPLRLRCRTLDHHGGQSQPHLRVPLADAAAGVHLRLRLPPSPGTSPCSSAFSWSGRRVRSVRGGTPASFWCLLLLAR